MDIPSGLKDSFLNSTNNSFLNSSGLSSIPNNSIISNSNSSFQNPFNSSYRSQNNNWSADNVPPQIIFNRLQTRSFASQFRQWSIEPIASSGQYWPGQIIKIFLNSFGSGVMDPYRSHLQITVGVNQQMLPVGLLQVDNSAQSFIQQLIIQSKSREIQRITQYGCLAAYLTDIGLSQLYAQGRQTQGLGYTNFQSNALNPQKGSNSSSNTPISTTSSSAPNNCFPTIPSKYNYAGQPGSQSQAINILANQTKGHININNSSWLANITQVGWWAFYRGYSDGCPNPATSNTASLYGYGYEYNIRAEYLQSHSNNKYVDSTSSFPAYQIHLDPAVMDFYSAAKWQTGLTYKTYIPQQIPLLYNASQTPDWASNVFTSTPNTCANNGFSNLYSPLFSKGTNQPFISPTVPQCQLQNGRILKQKIPIATKTFKIPFISAVIGILIPEQQFILIPLLALNDMLIQLTIDQFAMFTSGYNDIGQYDNVGMRTQQDRTFQVKRVSYKMHTYQFFSPQIDQYLKMSLQNGIAINSHYWQLGNQYQLQNSQSLTNAWPIACTQQALNQVVVLFYALDYQHFSFCRKHFRLSNNIIKFQLRLNMQYFPPQPYIGNGGNPIAENPFGDNSTFLQNVMWSNGYMFSNLTAAPRINAYNFAVNQRCYNPVNQAWLYDTNMRNNKDYQWSQTSVNADTAMGMPWIHQNRYVGRAAYVYTFQPYAHSSQLLVGVNCKSTKNFDIIFQAAPQNWFPRPQIMFVFTRSTNIIEYSTNGVININK